MWKNTPNYNSNIHFWPLGALGGGLGGPKSSGWCGRVLPTPDEFFLLPRLSFGHKNILREGMRVIFDITLLIIVLSPHPTIEISDNQGLQQQFFFILQLNVKVDKCTLVAP